MIKFDIAHITPSPMWSHLDVRWCTMMYDDVRWCTMMYDDVRKPHMLCHCQFFCLQLCHSIRLQPLDREVSMMSGVEGSVTGDASEKVLDVRSRILEALNLDGSGTHGTHGTRTISNYLELSELTRIWWRVSMSQKESAKRWKEVTVPRNQHRECVFCRWLDESRWCADYFGSQGFLCPSSWTQLKAKKSRYAHCNSEDIWNPPRQVLFGKC